MSSSKGVGSEQEAGLHAKPVAVDATGQRIQPKERT